MGITTKTDSHIRPIIHRAFPANLPAWNINDAHGNTITTAADGWHDSVGRLIPGSWTGYGSGSINDPGQQTGPIDTDPFPGIPSNETSRCNSGAIGTRTWTVLSSNDSGGSETYYFCYSQFHANTHFNFTGPIKGIQVANALEASFSAVLLTQIILPNNKSYSFQYDPDFLELTRIDLPTGGSISYVWNSVTWDNCSTALPIKRVVTQRTIRSGGGSPDSVWSYKWSNGGLCDPEPGAAPGVVITHPNGNDEWHPSKSGANPNNLPINDLIDDVFYYKGLTNNDPSNATGILLKKVETTSPSKESIFYMSNPESAITDPATGDVNWQSGNSIREYFPGSVEKTVTALYDPNTQQVQSSQETDTPSLPSAGTLDRWNPDYYAYPNNGHDTCACLNYSEIKTTKVYDVVQGAGSGTGAILRRTETNFRFQDSGGQPYADAGLTNLPSSVTTYDGQGNQAAQTKYGYDEGSYSASVIAGEQTTTQRWSGSNWISTHTKYNADGVWAGSIDANGNLTSAGAYDCSGMTPSNITLASGTSVAESVTYTHDCNTGAVTSYKDANGNTTSYHYADFLSRISSVDYPDGGHVGITYVDGPNSYINTLTTTGGPQGPISQTVSFDLLGRTISVHKLAPEGPTHQDTTYDPMGRIWTQSNPYINTSDATYGITTTSYDALGRKNIESHQDSSTLQWSYSGNTTTLTDEAGHQWQNTLDALGRLTNVTEPTGFHTSYSYDALGDLTGVVQTRTSGETARTRSFSYDPLSRLTQAYNPESGWTCYGNTGGVAPNGANCTEDYDGNGNLLSKTDARGIKIGYNYDALNRLARKVYSYGTYDGFGYDGKDESGGALSPAPTNLIGRLSHTSNAINAAETYSYDSMGRLTKQTQCIPSDCTYGVAESAVYDLAGNMTDFTYPDGHHIKQAWDSAGRLGSSNLMDINGNAVSQGYLQSANYFPDGSPHILTLGNGVQQTVSKNTRLQVQGIVDSSPLSLFNSQPFLSTAYCYVGCTSGGVANNGNIWQIADTLNAGNTQDYTYDALNRIISFSIGGVLKQQYRIDSFGNMTPMAGTNPVLTFDPVTNRINNLPCAVSLSPYDASGNQTCDTDTNGGLRSYTFDYENRPTQIFLFPSATSFVNYTYGGANSRVRKSKCRRNIYRVCLL
jgi:YD repeat-containing protein